MTISSEVTYGAGRPELYRELSAAEDRAATDTGRGAMPEDAAPSFEVSRGAAGEDWLSAILAFDRNMLGFDEALRDDSVSARYLTEVNGLPWPPPWVPPQYDATVQFQGLGGCGCERCGGGLGACGCRFSGLDSTDDDLDLDLHTTASFARTGSRLSGLASLGVTDTPDSDARRRQGMQQVLRAAALPTTKTSRVVTRRLLDQSSSLADQLEKYAAVAERATRFAGVSLKRAGVADAATQALVERIFDPRTGEPREDASPADLAKLRKLRRDAFEAGREAVRAEKVRILAKGQAGNSYAQAAILQKLAAATLGGQPEAAAVYAKMFDKIGQENAALRAMRHQQKAKWLQKEVSELSGLDDLGAIDARVIGADYWEADLDGLEIVEDAYLGELEGWLRRKLKKAGRKIKRGVKKVGRGIKRGAKAVGSATKSAARAAGRAAQRATQAAIKGASLAAKKAARAAQRGAKAIKNSTFAKNFMKVARPIGRSLKAAAKVAIAPAKMTFKVTSNIARGNFRGALRSVKGMAKETIKGLADTARNAVFGVACGLENTRLGRAAGQAVGQAVGTFYGGGQAGGAVGREAGRKANDINRGVCKGLSQMGLTGDQKLNFTARNLKRSLKVSARDLKRTTFSKQAMLDSAMRIAQGAVMGGGASIPGMSSLTDYGTKQFVKLGLNVIKDKGKKLLRDKGVQLLQRGASRVGSKIGGKAGRLIGGAVGRAAGAYAGGGRIQLPSAAQAVAIARRAGGSVTPGQVVAFAARRAGIPTTQAQAVAMAQRQVSMRLPANIPLTRAQVISQIQSRSAEIARRQAMARISAASAPNLFAQQIWG